MPMKKSGHGNANWGSQNDVSLSKNDSVSRQRQTELPFSHSQEILEGTLLIALSTPPSMADVKTCLRRTGVDLARSGDYGRPHSPSEVGATKVRLSPLYLLHTLTYTEALFHVALDLAVLRERRARTRSPIHRLKKWISLRSLSLVQSVSNVSIFVSIGYFSRSLALSVSVGICF